MDQLDRKILRILQHNGRITNAELARLVGLAPSSTLDRVRRLEENGTIQGYGAKLDPKSLGLKVQGFISIRLTKHDSKCIEAFEREIRKTPYVLDCYLMTGNFDYLLHVAVRDLRHMGELIQDHIARLPHIGRAESFLTLTEIKSNGGYFVELDEDNNQG